MNIKINLSWWFSNVQWSASYFFFTLLLSVNLSKNMFFCVYHMMLHYIIWYSQCKEDLMIIDDQLSFIQRTHHFDIGNAEYSFCNDRWVKCEHNNEISYSTTQSLNLWNCICTRNVFKFTNYALCTTTHVIRPVNPNSIKNIRFRQ